MVYTPTYTASDIKGITTDTVGTVGASVKDGVSAPIDMGFAGMTAGIGMKSVSTLMKPLTKLKARRLR